MEDVQQSSRGLLAVGRTEGFQKLHFPADQIPMHCVMHPNNTAVVFDNASSTLARRPARSGDYVAVTVDMDDTGSLTGSPLGFSSITHFDSFRRDASQMSHPCYSTASFGRVGAIVA